jgi:hypothetical protein
LTPYWVVTNIEDYLAFYGVFSSGSSVCVWSIGWHLP